MVPRLMLASVSLAVIFAVVGMIFFSSPSVPAPDGLLQFATTNSELQKYYELPATKAFAASVTLNAWGWGYEYRTQDGAERRALRECEVRGVKCLLYAVGDKIVWDPARAYAELSSIVSSQATVGAVWHYYDDKPAHGVTVSMPPEAHSIISDFGARRGVLGNIRGLCARCNPRHTGIDIIGETGTPVLAAADGIVVTSDYREIAGNTVRIRHADPASGKPLVTRYIHLDQMLVETGDRVIRGQTIGTIGVTGSGTTMQRPHLHFEVDSANPHLFWHDGPGKVTCYNPIRAFAAGGLALTYPVPCGRAEGDREARLRGR